MPRPKSTPTDPWHKLLQQELERPDGFTPEHRTLAQLREMRRRAKLPSGETATYAWVNALKKAGKIRADSFFVRRGGRLVRDVRYLFL